MLVPSTRSLRAAALLVLTAAMLSSCVAEMVEKKKPRKGPVPEVGYIDTGGGELRYSTEGWGWIVQLRRATALHRMRSLCGDLQPKISDEFTHDDADTPYDEDDMTELARGVNHYNVAPFHHILFECKGAGPAPTPAAAPAPAEALNKPAAPAPGAKP